VSRADHREPARDGVLPAIGGLQAIAPSVRDLLEHPLPLITANVVWGLVALVAWSASLLSPVLAVLALVVLVWPTVAVATVAARVVRDEEVGIRDAFRWPIRRPAVVLLGLMVVAGVAIGGTDIVLALGRGDLLGVAFATAAAWGLIALWALACVAWPLLGDPARADRGATAVARLTLTVALLHTSRVLGAAVLIALMSVVSTVLIAAILTISVSLAALVLCRVMLPLADVVERTPK
jgi:hypothetical protein